MENTQKCITLQRQASALWKWGKRYPNLWPKYQEWSAEVYKADRVLRGVE